MTTPITLRQRILLTLLPLLILLGVVGIAGVLLLLQLGGSIDVILRDNYNSVLAMQDLKEALERIDSSFQFMMVAQGLQVQDERNSLTQHALEQFDANWDSYQHALAKEQANITIHPKEDQLVERLSELTRDYRQQSEEFYRRSSTGDVRHQDYYDKQRLYDLFLQIKQTADEILQLNQHEMKRASQVASRSATTSLIWLSVGSALAVFLAGLSAWHTIRSTLSPIQAVTQAALGISAGNLDQVVPVFSRDELGQLAESFNVMAHRLRDYRQSQSVYLRRAQRTSQATIDSFPDSVLVIDSEGHIEMANPMARQLLGIPHREPDQPPTDIWYPPDQLREQLNQALLGQHDYLPEGFDHIILMGKDGGERALLPRILTIRDSSGKTLGAAVLLQDVTRLRLLDQMKSDLVATASHELKTPLTSIRLAVHLLLEESTGPLTPKQTELLLDARENSERLLAMVNNLLDLARLEQGWRKLDVHPVSPKTLLRDAAESIEARAQDKKVHVELDVPDGLPTVPVDKERIGHALRNLLDNALTYTDAGGSITLSAQASGDTVVFSVSDTGTGIASEYLPHIFEKFFRVPGQSRGIGTGLGLAIVHEIVIGHGGTIHCESQPGVGTTFRIRLPISHAELYTEMPPATLDRTSGPLTEGVSSE
jgi:two-component system, NtrC family, sensor histidine kinase KinB